MKQKVKTCKMRYALRALFMCILAAAHLFASAQVFSDKIVGEKNKEIIDSLKRGEYKYLLPIWGAKAVKAGFDLPYSAGLGINYLTQESAILINNLQVGINNSPLYNLDDLVRFNNATARTQSVNIRPDIWLFPFLNVYGIFARSKTSTEVDFSLWLPGATGSEEIFRYNTTANFKASSVGFGLTPTMGIGGGWLALDMNFTWTDIPELEKPTYSFVFGPRLGKSFRLKNPESNITIWVGGFRVNLKPNTKGAIQLGEVLPTDNIDDKINTGIEKVGQKQEELDDWYNGLSAQDKVLNKVRYELASAVLVKANDLLYRLADGAGTLESSRVQYSLNKELKDKWNFIVGSQFQLNKHWMIRAEFGFLGSRKQFIGGLQYRFGL